MCVLKSDLQLNNCLNANSTRSCIGAQNPTATVGEKRRCIHVYKSCKLEIDKRKPTKPPLNVCTSVGVKVLVSEFLLVMEISGVATRGLGGRVPPPAYKSRFLKWPKSSEKFFKEWVYPPCQ